MITTAAVTLGHGGQLWRSGRGELEWSVGGSLVSQVKNLLKAPVVQPNKLKKTRTEQKAA